MADAASSTPPLPTDSHPADIRVELASNPAYLCAMREMIGVATRRMGFPDAIASKIVLAVDEALANVMVHGYERRLDGRIWISLFREGGSHDAPFDSLRIVIEDEGRQVDPCVIKSRDLDDIRPGGLGVHIIKETMDFCKYERRDDKGMRLTLIKRLPPEAHAPAPCPHGGSTHG
jgi:anti-sigma regulatory factor (Ser/Thr protein kinase)